MSKFKKKAQTSQQISTSSLPDIIFMLLFFFMVTTVLRENTINVKQVIPDASQLRKLQRKSLVSYIYIGEPKKVEQWGTEPRIQVNDVFREPKDLIKWVNEEKSKLSEIEKDQLTVSLKVDEEVKRGLIADVETELRKANSRKVLYSTRQKILD
jgi:biopolymer transport protein ExbD